MIAQQKGAASGATPTTNANNRRVYRPSHRPSRPKRKISSPRRQARFEARRLHSLLRLAEGARDARERSSHSDAVLRRLRQFLSQFYGLRGAA